MLVPCHQNVVLERSGCKLGNGKALKEAIPRPRPLVEKFIGEHLFDPKSRELVLRSVCSLERRFLLGL